METAVEVKGDQKALDATFGQSEEAADKEGSVASSLSPDLKTRTGDQLDSSTTLSPNTRARRASGLARGLISGEMKIESGPNESDEVVQKAKQAGTRKTASTIQAEKMTDDLMEALTREDEGYVSGKLPVIKHKHSLTTGSLLIRVKGGLRRTMSELSLSDPGASFRRCGRRQKLCTTLVMVTALWTTLLAGSALSYGVEGFSPEARRADLARAAAAESIQPEAVVRTRIPSAPWGIHLVEVQITETGGERLPNLVPGSTDCGTWVASVTAYAAANATEDYGHRAHEFSVEVHDGENPLRCPLQVSSTSLSSAGRLLRSSRSSRFPYEVFRHTRPKEASITTGVWETVEFRFEIVLMNASCDFIETCSDGALVSLRYQRTQGERFELKLGDLVRLRPSVEDPQIVWWQLRSIGLVCSILTGSLACLVAGWLFTRWHHPTIQGGEPINLVAIWLGLVAASVIIACFAIIDDSPLLGLSESQVSIFCRAEPFVFCTMFTLQYAPLLVTGSRTARVMEAAIRFRKVKPSARRLAVSLILNFIVQYTICLIWICVDPPKFERLPVYRDSLTGRVLASAGACRSGRTGLASSLLLFVWWQAVFFSINIRLLSKKMKLEMSQRLSNGMYARIIATLNGVLYQLGGLILATVRTDNVAFLTSKIALTTAQTMILGLILFPPIVRMVAKFKHNEAIDMMSKNAKEFGERRAALALEHEAFKAAKRAENRERTPEAASRRIESCRTASKETPPADGRRIHSHSGSRSGNFGSPVVEVVAISARPGFQGESKVVSRNPFDILGLEGPMFTNKKQSREAQ